MKNKVRNVLAALVLCMSAVALPVTAYASTGSDTTPPTLTAALKDDKLAVEASDDLSGVEAVYVDGTRINSLVNGKGTVALKDYAGDGKEVTVYAVDYSGNRSKEVKLDNPYYEEPAQTQAASSAAPQSSSGETQAAPSTTPAPSPSANNASSSSSNSESSQAAETPSTSQAETEASSESPAAEDETESACRKGPLPRKAPARSWTQPPGRKMISSFIPSPPRTEMCFTLCSRSVFRVCGKPGGIRQRNFSLDTGMERQRRIYDLAFRDAGTLCD